MPDLYVIGAFLALVIVVTAAARLVIWALERRRRRRAQSDVARRIAAIGRLTPPDQLPRAPAVTKSMRRRFTYRLTPRPRKRRTGRWA